MKSYIGIAVLAAVFTLSGCVSTGEFEKMQAGKNEQITKLQQQKASLEQDNSALKQQIASQEQQNAAMQQQVGSLEQQKAELLEASQQRQQQESARLSNPLFTTMIPPGMANAFIAGFFETYH